MPIGTGLSLFLLLAISIRASCVQTAVFWDWAFQQYPQSQCLLIHWSLGTFVVGWSMRVHHQWLYVIISVISVSLNGSILQFISSFLLPLITAITCNLHTIGFSSWWLNWIKIFLIWPVAVKPGWNFLCATTPCLLSHAEQGLLMHTVGS